MRKWLGILCGLLILCGCSGPTLQRQTFTVELGKDVYANAALYLRNADNYPTEDWEVEARSSGVVKKQNRFTSKNLDYLVVGDYDFAILTGKEEIPFTIAVKDTQAPTIESYSSDITVSKGAVINWSDYIQASDLSGVSYTVSDSLDTSVAGSYDVTVQISDRFGNSAERSIHVNVS